MRAVNHYLFCDGENDPVLSPIKRHDWGHPVRKDGTLRRHYFRYPKLSSALHAYGRDLVVSHLQTVTRIGFLLDYFKTEVYNTSNRAVTDIISHQRSEVLFDFIARGLALTHRPFDAVDLTRSALDPLQTPLLWVMMEKQCNADVQQKLLEYVQNGGKLVLAGRMCVEEFDHTPCTLLKDALGIQQVEDDKPFEPNEINAFQYVDIPVSFLETYRGNFSEVIASHDDGRVAGFIQPLGKGSVLVFGAAMTANTLDDLDVVNQIALKMGCLPLFQTSEWVDVRLSTGEKGSFLFVSNYQDDLVAPVIHQDGATLLGGYPVNLPARTGMILPLELQVMDGVKINFATSEIRKIEQEGSSILLEAAQEEFLAEMTLNGYQCDAAERLESINGLDHVRLFARDGKIILYRK
jgi:beta-galactosidase